MILAFIYWKGCLNMLMVLHNFRNCKWPLYILFVSPWKKFDWRSYDTAGLPEIVWALTLSIHRLDWQVDEIESKTSGQMTFSIGHHVQVFELVLNYAASIYNCRPQEELLLDFTHVATSIDQTIKPLRTSSQDFRWSELTSLWTAPWESNRPSWWPMLAEASLIRPETHTLFSDWQPCENCCFGFPIRVDIWMDDWAANLMNAAEAATKQTQTAWATLGSL